MIITKIWPMLEKTITRIFGTPTRNIGRTTEAITTTTTGIVPHTATRPTRIEAIRTIDRIAAIRRIIPAVRTPIRATAIATHIPIAAIATPTRPPHIRTLTAVPTRTLTPRVAHTHTGTASHTRIELTVIRQTAA